MEVAGKAWHPSPLLQQHSKVLRESAGLDGTPRISLDFSERALQIVNDNCSGPTTETLHVYADVVRACDYFDLPPWWCTRSKLILDFAKVETVRQSGLANMFTEVPLVRSLTEKLARRWPSVFVHPISDEALHMWVTSFVDNAVNEWFLSAVGDDETMRNAFKDDPMALAIAGGRKVLEPYARELKDFHTDPDAFAKF